MFHLIKGCNMPKWLKVVLYVLLSITLVYVIGLVIYKVLEAIRWLLHAMTEKKIWWVSVCIIFVLSLIFAIILEKTSDIKPFTLLYEWLLSVLNSIKNLF